jgi:hypothetical protein
MRCPVCRPADQEKRCTSCDLPPGERHGERIAGATLAAPGTVHYACECECGASWVVTVWVAPEVAERLVAQAQRLPMPFEVLAASAYEAAE